MRTKIYAVLTSIQSLVHLSINLRDSICRPHVLEGLAADNDWVRELDLSRAKAVLPAGQHSPRVCICSFSRCHHIITMSPYPIHNYRIDTYNKTDGPLCLYPRPSKGIDPLWIPKAAFLF